MDSSRVSRRELFALAGTVAAGSTLAACGSAAGSTKPAHRSPTTDLTHFRSRPDLKPPVIDVTGDFSKAGGTDVGYVFLTPGGPMIVDVRGEPIWYRPAPHYSTNLRVQQFQGEPVLTWWQGTAPYGVGATGEYFVLDSHYKEVTRVKGPDGIPADLHEFVIAPDGTAYFTGYQPVTADLTAIGGPKRAKSFEAWIQGVDLATGKLVFQWRSSDHIALSETYRKYKPTSKWPYTPVHLNSIDPLPDGNLLVSSRHTWTIYKIDRTTGKILWRLGGKESDFVLGPGVHFAWQHDVEWHSGNLLTIFDNESPPPEAKQSAGLVLQVTETAKTVTLLHAYHYPGEDLLVGAQGSVQFLPGGDVFMGWGLQPYFTQYHHDGTAVLKGKFKKQNSYRAYRVPWTGTPTEPPAIALEARSGNDLRVYASWNGATEVARWAVLAGRAHDALSQLHTTARTGFETAIDVSVPSGTRFVAARALDGSGRTLATSQVTRI